MSLCTVLMGVGGTGKSSVLKYLFQSIVFKSEQPEGYSVEVVTLEMAETVETKDSSEQSVKMNFCSMLEEALRKLWFQEKMKQWQRYLEQKLSNQYRTMFVEHTGKLNSTIKARKKEYVVSRVQNIIDIHKCIDAIRDDLLFDIEAIRSDWQEYVKHVSHKSQCVYIRNAMKALAGHIEHLGRNQNVRKNPIRVLFKRRLTEPNQASQNIGLCLRTTLCNRMFGSAT